jgi:hypothetical protein
LKLSATHFKGPVINCVEKLLELLSWWKVIYLENKSQHGLMKNLNCFESKTNGPNLFILVLCTTHVKLGVFLRVPYCVVDTSYGLGRSLGDCRLALPKGRKYQMVKTQTESHVRRPIVWSNRWQIWVFFSFVVCRGTAGICHAGLWRFFEAL